MKSLILSPAAVADIDGIYDYTEARWGYEKAELYTFGLRDSCAKLADGEMSGRYIKGLKAGYRVLAYEAHFIVYRESGTGVRIVRILHRRMNIARHL